MPYLGNTPADKYSSYSVQHFTTSATTSYTLDFPVANENEIELFINNVRQEPGSSYAYTASGTSLTLSAATSASDTMYCVFQGKSTQTVAPATGSVTNAMLAGSIANDKLAGGIESSKLAFASYPYRNLIINGDMSIAQRGTTQSIGSGAGYIIDRWRDGAIYNTVPPTGAFTVSKSTDVPTGQGFVSSQKWACTTAQTSLTEQGWGTQQRIEAQNLTHLSFGSASAKTLTLSFWIKSNKTGTYGIEIRSHDASRQFISSYTIDSANTWEKKTITITGDTGGSGIANDNGIGFWVRWIWSAGTTIDGATLNSWTATATEIAPTGQVNLADSTSNELYWTGVQLEVGTTASDFEFLPYDVNFQRCERYFQFIQGFQGQMAATTNFTAVTTFRTPMRSAPSATVYGTGVLVITDNTSDFSQSSASGAILAGRVTTYGVQCYYPNFSGLTTFRPAHQNVNVNDFKMGMDAEL